MVGIGASHSVTLARDEPPPQVVDGPAVVEHHQLGHHVLGDRSDRSRRHRPSALPRWRWPGPEPRFHQRHRPMRKSASRGRASTCASPWQFEGRLEAVSAGSHVRGLRTVVLKPGGATACDSLLGPARRGCNMLRKLGQTLHQGPGSPAGASESIATTASWQVYVLVAATARSSPAYRASTSSAAEAIGESGSLVMASVGRRRLRASSSTPTRSGDWPDREIPTTSAPSRDGGWSYPPNSDGAAEAHCQSVARSPYVLGIAGGVVRGATCRVQHPSDVRPVDERPDPRPGGGFPR